MFDTVELVVSGKIVYKKDLIGGSDLEKCLLPYMSPRDFICPKVNFRSQMYCSGDIVVLEAYNQDEIKVGLVSTMLIRNEVVFFVIRQFLTRRTLLRYFKGSSVNQALSLFDSKNLADYKPLINQGTSSHVIFCLHHHLSAGFD